MRNGEWVRWLGVVAALAALACLIFIRRFPIYLLGGTPYGPGELGYIAFWIFPAFATVFLCGFSRFWWALPIGLWLLLFSTIFYVDRSSSPTSLLFVLAAATICITPFLDRACRSTGPGTKEDAQPEDDPLDTTGQTVIREENADERALELLEEEGRKLMGGGEAKDTLVDG